MTTKQQVDLEVYQKPPRRLAEPMEIALGFGGGLHPVLKAVIHDPRLRLDIRDGRFNVYYGGGNLMLVDGRTSPWELHFDKKYFKGGTSELPTLPPQFSSIDDARIWVQAFPTLIAGMEYWWTRNPKGERTHCQAMAAANSGIAGVPPADYLVLDMEYQWAQRRFDLVAAKRRPTENDATGWTEPDLVFVEVKSEYNACSGMSGIEVHAQDYLNIITSSNGRHVKDIKLEYENVIAQKMRLGLLNPSLGFKRFSPAVPELLFVLINLDPNTLSVKEPLKRVSELGDSTQIRFMRLTSPNYVMTADNSVSVERLIAGNT